MRASLTALTEELRRLKASGLREISVAPESLERLRAAVRKRKPSARTVAEAPANANADSRMAAAAAVFENHSVENRFAAPANRSASEPRAESFGELRSELRPTRESPQLAQTEDRFVPANSSPALGATVGYSGAVSDSTDSPRPSTAPQRAAAFSTPVSPAAPPASHAASAHFAPAASMESTLPPPPLFNVPTEGTKAERLAALREIVLQDEVCRAQLRPGKQLVFGVGSPDAQIVFVGEAPGAEEERQGEPFVGPAGKLLTKMIQAMGLAREDVYIANIMNWRPQMPTVRADGEQVGNRPPTPEEMAYCLPYLQAQLAILAPQVIVALGATAARGLLGHDAFKTLGELRGKWREFAGCPLMVTYHPSYILRNQSNRSKRVIWEDFLKVMERATLPISDKQRSYFLGP